MASKENNMPMVIKMIRIIGLLFIAAGFTLAWFPEKIEGYISGISADETQFFGGILIVIGMIDLLIIPRILNLKNNETK